MDIYTSLLIRWHYGIILAYQGSGNSAITYIKFGSAPSSSDDYDSYCDLNGNITGDNFYTGETKLYVWGQNSAVKINISINVKSII